MKRPAHALLLAVLAATPAVAAPLQFDFNTPDRVAPYTPAAGHGFDAGAVPAFTNGCVAADQPFLFSTHLPEGNYTVQVALGHPSLPSVTTVKAECRRVLSAPIPVAAGQTVTQTFTVHVRTPRLPDGTAVRIKERERPYLHWDERLSLEFCGEHPSARTIILTPDTNAPTLFLAGDSTVTDQPAEPWSSWGQILPRFFKPGIAVANYAESGETIRSSLSARRFDKIFATMRAGDCLLLQFGHNDMKDTTTNAPALYADNLRALVTRTRALGGVPVLVTSMERRTGIDRPTLGPYPGLVREVAAELDVPLIDLQTISRTLYRGLGRRLDAAFQDGTHHTTFGACLLAQCVARELARLPTPASAYLLDDVASFDPAQPDLGIADSIPPSAHQDSRRPDGDMPPPQKTR